MDNAVGKLQLCSNSKCPMAQSCNKNVVHYSELGMVNFTIRHLHPTGQGQNWYCRDYSKREWKR